MLPAVATSRLGVPGTLRPLLGNCLAAGGARCRGRCGWRGGGALYGGRLGTWDGSRWLRGGGWNRRSTVRARAIPRSRFCERHLNLAAPQRVARFPVVFRARSRHVHLLCLRERRTDTDDEQNCRENKSPRRALRRGRLTSITNRHSRTTGGECRPGGQTRESVRRLAFRRAEAAILLEQLVASFQ